MFSANRWILHPASCMVFLAITSTYLSCPNRSVFHMMSVCVRTFATSDSIGWNCSRAYVVLDMAASSYFLMMVNPLASAHVWASFLCCSMLASFCECDENQ